MKVKSVSPTRFALAGRVSFGRRSKRNQKIWCPRPRRLRRSPSLLGRNGQSRFNSLRSDRRACSIPFRPALLRRVSRAQKTRDGPLLRSALNCGDHGTREMASVMLCSGVSIDASSAMRRPGFSALDTRRRRAGRNGVFVGMPV